MHEMRQAGLVFSDIFEPHGETVVALMQIPSKTTKERHAYKGKSFCFLLHNTLVFYSYKALEFPVTEPANAKLFELLNFKNLTRDYVKKAYSRTPVKRPSIKRPPSFKRPIFDECVA